MIEQLSHKTRNKVVVLDWMPADVTGDYDGPYYVYERVPVRGCYLRWQLATIWRASRWERPTRTNATE
jgi:hypothetical protein